MNTRAYLGELLGTFLFMMLGYASVSAVGVADPPISGLVVVPFGFGLGLLAAIFAFGHLSGGHYNPAVTIAMILDKRTTPADGLAYIIAQVIGAIGAAAVILVAISQSAVAAGISAPGPGVSESGALILETIFTAIFLVVILTVTKKAPGLAAIAIPLTLVGIHFAIATTSGSSVNPARSIGSAVVGGDLSNLWIYLVGPTIGGIIGYAIYKVTGADDEPASA